MKATRRKPAKAPSRGARAPSAVTGAGGAIAGLPPTDREPNAHARRMARAYRALAQCSRALVRATAEEELLRQLCRILVQVGEYHMAWVGYALDDAGRTVRPVAQAGFSEGYVESIRVTWADEPSGRGPTGTAIRTGRPVVVRDARTDPCFAPWREQAAERGFVSCIGLPIVLPGGVVGALMVYAAREDAFDADEEELLLRLTEDVAFGIGALRDRTQRERAEEQLRRAQRMEALGLLAGGIAHDLDDLVTVMLASSGSALARAPATGPLREDVEEFRAAAEKARSVTSQLLAFGRRQVLEPARLELRAWLPGMEKALRGVVGERVDVRVVVPEGPAPILADPAQIEQLLVVLASNARDAMPLGGTLTVQAAEVAEPPGVLLSVADTGVGMDAPTRARIFEPFFTTKPIGKGTGLGLATASGIVERAEGTIRVESAPGKGSRFEIRFPRLADAVRAQAPGQLQKSRSPTSPLKEGWR